MTSDLQPMLTPSLVSTADYIGRHTFATNLYLQTKDAKATSKWLGHTSAKSTEVYIHLAEQVLFEKAKQIKQIVD